jgi:uncharacterized sporulation protein YeaH/YhbH (DUF444 family)
VSAAKANQKNTANYGKRGTRAQANLKREAVIAATVRGETAEKIAADLGVNQRRVEAIRAEPETQLKIAELLQPHTEKVKRITKRVIETIEDDLDENSYLARSAARRDFVALLNLAQPKGEQPTPGLIQFNQLNILVQQIVQKRDGA